MISVAYQLPLTFSSNKCYNHKQHQLTINTMPKLIYAPLCKPQSDRYLKRLTYRERHQQELLRYRIRLDSAVATV